MLKEKAHFMDLLTDAQDRANTWLERADNLFSFAKTAKTRFENGTIIADPQRKCRMRKNGWG